MDRKRDAPIPWSVSLPCVAAVVALVLGWRMLGRRNAAPPAARVEKTPAPTATTSGLAPEPGPSSAPDLSPRDPPATSPSAAPSPVPTPAPIVGASESKPAPTAPHETAVAKEPWTPLSKFGAEGFLTSDSATSRQAVAAVVRMRDRLGRDAARYFVRAEPSSRTLVVTSERGRTGRGEKLVGLLAPFGARLDALVLRPAGIAASTRPWVAAYVAEDDPAPLGADHFVGFSAGAGDGLHDLREVGRLAGVAQLRRLLAPTPESRPLEWLVVGAVGAAASDSLADAIRCGDPALPSGSSALAGSTPSLAQIVAWRTEAEGGDSQDSARRAALAASFVAFGLERGPKDPRAAGLCELLRADGRALPTDPAAYEAEIAARLGATRLDELDAAWRAARR